METKEQKIEIKDEELEQRVARIKTIWDRIPGEFKGDTDITFRLMGRAEDIEKNRSPEIGILLGGKFIGAIGLFGKTADMRYENHSYCFWEASRESKEGFYCPDGETIRELGPRTLFDEAGNALFICPYTTKCAKIQTFLKEYEQKYVQKAKTEEPETDSDLELKARSSEW
jgi:hypothetical protein